jgi:16S rRNA (guanine527-N7)-methyltransferase
VKFRELLFQEFLPYATLSSEQLQLLEDHFKLLLRWNRTLNLTRIDDPEEAVRFHYCESLFLGLKLPAGPLRIVDVGSGAGFPGIPIAVLRSDIELTLMESNQRKAVFLREASAQLTNARVLACRAEDCTETFDWMVARAVSAPEVLRARLAPNWALLVASKDVPEDSEVLALPWGRDRVIAVPRGTTPC